MASAAAKIIQKSVPTTDNSFSFKVEDRGSLELVIAFVGPVGSGVTTASDILINQLRDNFGYGVEYIKMSALIKEYSTEVGETIADNLDANERIERYQQVGNKLRQQKGGHYLVDRAIEKIALSRISNDGFVKVENGVDVAIQKRSAYIIDSIKNPAEVERLKNIYGDLFWLVTVFAPHNVRERRLKSMGLDDLIAGKVMKKDQDEEKDFGQKVSKTAHLADYFIRNHKDTKSSVVSAVERFLEVVFSTKLHTPTFEEQGMMKAAAAGIQSACLSRQVGAAIFSKDKELLGVGCNDVPKAGGGLYNESMGENDNRCFKWGGNVCHNDERKSKMARNIARSVNYDKDDTNDVFGKTFNAVTSSEAKNLIEFSRSVHAEMEAIVSIARAGTGSTINGTLFTTTFPCHNCARHIVAAGITKVVFIEPYSKSLALDLHHDAISMSEETGKVHFLQYEGFSPQVAIRIFSSVGRDRKQGGKFVAPPARSAKPLFPFPLDSYINSERLIVQQLTVK
ncbi:MAG: deoxycytidylate deaminase [Sphingomonas sp.]|nr:MAG: deoxycytidylate deaminase [Sphingomonas sp.]